MTGVESLPFDIDLGYPQKQTVSVNGIAYTAYFRWNPEDGGFAILKIYRNTDNAIVCNTRIENLTPVSIRDPITYVTEFIAFPYLITEKKCEVWVFYD